MGKVTTTVELPYPADLVFRVATRVEDLPRWLPEVVDAELLDAVLETGARIRLRLGPAAANAELTGVVEAMVAPERLIIAGTGGPLSVSVRTDLEADGPFRTQVTLEVTLATPPFLGFIAKEAERRIGEELPVSMARFQALLDAEPS
jgi:hypothetical protein